MPDNRETVPRYGEQPLAQTIAAAAGLRRIANILVSLEHSHPAVDEMIERFGEWENRLKPVLPKDSSPRVGEAKADSQRVYLDHAADIWAFNPVFPEYSFEFIGDEDAHGTVNFPVIFEGPPGLVHGGFLGVFFDCVVQHQSCVIGMSGKTRSMNVRYRRPTPILTDLHFDITRSESAAGIDCVARLILGDEMLCKAEISTVSVPADKLVTTHFGKRRSIEP
jgi:hypothetical protein